MRYHQFGRSGETVYQDLDVNTEQVTLNNLIPGKVYVISISGYTSAGEGKTRTVSAACKFCNLLRKVLSLSDTYFIRCLILYIIEMLLTYLRRYHYLMDSYMNDDF